MKKDELNHEYATPTRASNTAFGFITYSSAPEDEAQRARVGRNRDELAPNTVDAATKTD